MLHDIHIRMAEEFLKGHNTPPPPKKNQPVNVHVFAHIINAVIIFFMSEDNALSSVVREQHTYAHVKYIS